MKFNRKWTIGAMVGACIIAGGALWKASAKPATRYATAAVTVGNLEQTVLAVGRLHAKELVAVGAQVSGQVKRLHVELGQQVKAGDLIAEVDAQPQRIKLRNAEASVTALQAQLAAGGYEPVGSTPEALQAHIDKEITRWATVVKSTGARVD